MFHQIFKIIQYGPDSSLDCTVVRHLTFSKLLFVRQSDHMNVICSETNSLECPNPDLQRFLPKRFLKNRECLIKSSKSCSMGYSSMDCTVVRHLTFSKLHFFRQADHMHVICSETIVWSVWIPIYSAYDPGVVEKTANVWKNIQNHAVWPTAPCTAQLSFNWRLESCFFFDRRIIWMWSAQKR